MLHLFSRGINTTKAPLELYLATGGVFCKAGGERGSCQLSDVSGV